MQLNSLIAKQIVDRAKKIIKYSINVMDENGVIIGSSDPSRLHQTHEGALLAIRDNRTLEINDSVASTLSGVRKVLTYPLSMTVRLSVWWVFPARLMMCVTMVSW
ncbi:sugar diacid utilization regulator sdaR [Vibrio ishigakensis]|uniref:Sugar diacid utilization regulator sdaR n=1 Tax=Vibrio ishigakensis TaxID=1481914 RepID=A0A0B8PG42_9VIBR|nr:sugar diacid utilization regulator sdaR [Vibrio ishigakensis]